MSSTEPSKSLVQRAPEVAGGALRALFEYAIDGLAMLPSAKAAAAKALESKGNHDAALDLVVLQHVGLASAQGFVTNLGGLATVAVALPANIAGAAIVQIRMLASIAHLRGYDIDDRRVRTALAVAMLGEDEVRKQIASGRIPSTPLGIATAPMFDDLLDRQISERVLGDLAAKIGGKHLGVFVAKRVPLIGGGVGAVADGYLTYVLGSYARREFVSRQRISRG